MPFDVQDKVALVTGANRGIGKVIVQRLLDAGAARVYAAVRDPQSVAELAAALDDLSQPQTIISAAQTAKDVELVVNNAGVLKAASPLSKDAIDALDFEILVNVKGLIHMAQAFAPVLQANGLPAGIANPFPTVVAYQPGSGPYRPAKSNAQHRERSIPAALH